MPTKAGPPVEAKEDLIFAFDQGDRKNSFRGKPTINRLLNTNLDTGWSKGYTKDRIIPDLRVRPPKGIKSQVVSFVNNSTSSKNSYWYSYGDYAPQDPGVTYTISVYARTIGDDFGFRAYTANNSETGRYWGNMQYITGNGKWQRLKWTFTNATNSQSDSLSFNLDAPIGQRVWMCAPMLEEGTIASKFTTETRTVTDALKDLANNSTFTLSNMSYNSDGTLYFDGTDARVTVDNISYPSKWGDPFSFEAVIKVPASASWSNGGSGTTIIGRGGYAGSIGLIRSSTNNRVAFWIRTDSNIFDAAILNLARDTYHHIIGTWDGVNTAKIYHNGQYVAQEVNSNISGVPDGGNISIGGGNAFGGNTGNYGEAEIPIAKMYRTALTDSQVKRNYNAIKGRFNI